VWRVQLCCLPSMVDDHVVRHVAIMLFVICHGGLSLSLSLSTHTHTHTHTHTQRSPVCTCACGPLITFHHCSPWQLWAFLMGFLLIIIL
jgi:hypothetical protein